MITKRDMKFFEVAKAVSLTGSYRIKIGCCIVKHHKVISVGVNSVKTHPLQKALNLKHHKQLDMHRLHAEMYAISKVHTTEDLQKASIYVYRQGVKGELRNCRPCPACMDRIIDMGIKYIFYTDQNGYHKEEVLRDK